MSEFNLTIERVRDGIRFLGLAFDHEVFVVTMQDLLYLQRHARDVDARPDAQEIVNRLGEDLAAASFGWGRA